MSPFRLLLLAAILSSAAAQAASKPNVVFILADDLGVNDLSLYGSKFMETPRIDALAKRGLMFTRAYAASPLCSPTRSSILTGLYPARTGITSPMCHLPTVVLDKHLAEPKGNERILTADPVTRLKTDYYTLAKAFKADGYTTAHFGKWHLGAEPYSPLQHGFDTDVPHTSAPSPLPKGFFYPFPVWPNHGKPGDNLEDLLCDEAVKFIENRSPDHPFFLNYWSFEVHSPWQAKTSQIDKYRAKMDPKSLQRNPVYAGMTETFDEVVGRLLDALDKKGLADNTLIVVTSDNGEYFNANAEHMPPEFHKVPVSNAYPLRAGKGTVYEGGTRVPLVIVWPGKISPNTVTDGLFQSTDFFPTFADLLEWKLPASVHFDGLSLRPLLEGKPSPRQEIFCHFPHPESAADYEQMPAPTPPGPASSIMQENWKLIRFFAARPDGSDRFELYDLAKDPSEAHDLSATNPARADAMKPRLAQLLADTEAVIPVVNPSHLPATRQSAP